MPKVKATLTPTDIKLLKSIFLTKQDANNFATKSDLKQFATKSDLNGAVDRIFKYTNQTFATKAELAEIRQLVNTLPTKEEFFSRMDKLSAEYTTFTQEKTILLQRFADLEQKVYSTPTS